MADEQEQQPPVNRRGFFRNLWLLGGLGAAYGTLGYLALRFLLPGRSHSRKARMFVTTTRDLPPGKSTSFTTPDGEKYLLTNTGQGLQPFIAFSSRCPHLGCKVHWQGEQKRFYCPCHGGAFDSRGKATEGPPKAAEQTLKACELKIEGQAIYALVERA